MSFWRKTGLIVGIISILIAIALIGAHTSPARSYVLGQLTQQLRSQGVDLRASRLDYNLLTLSVTMRDVVVRATKATDLPPIAVAQAAKVDVSLLDLLRGEVRIEGAEVQRLKLHVIQTADSRNNIPESETPDEPKQDSGFNLPQIDEMKIADASLLYEDRAQALSVSLPNWKVEVDGRLQGEAVHFTTLSPGMVDYAGRSTPVERVELRGVLHPDREVVQLEQLTLRAAESQITLEGTVEGFGQPRLQMRAEGNLKLEPIASLLQMKEEMRGTLALKVAAAGPLNELRLGLQANGEDVVLAGFRQLDLTLDSRYRSSAKLLDVTALHLATSEGSVDGQAQLALDATAESSLNLRLNGLNLLRITRALDLPMRIASTATGTVQASFPGTNVKKADGNAQLTFSRLRSRPAEKVLPLSGRIRARARNGAVTLEIGKQAGPSSVGEFLDATAFLRPATSDVNSAAYHPAILAIPAEQFKSSLRTGHANPFTSAGFRRSAFHQAPASQQQPQPSQPLQTLATLLRGTIAVSPTGAISGTLSADFADLQQTLERLRLLLGREAPLSPVPIRGRGQATVELSGTIENPAADMKFNAPALSVGTLKGVAFAMDANYDPAKLLIRNARLGWQQAEVRLEGEVGLKGKNPALDLTASLRNVTVQSLLAAAQKQTIPAEGILSGEAHVKGTTAEPEAQFRLSAEQVVAYNEPFGRTDVEGTFRGNQLQISRLAMRKPDGGSLQLAGSYHLTSGRYQLKANTDGFRIRQLQLPNGKSVTAALDLRAQGSGTRDNPQMTANVNATNVNVDGTDFGSLAMDLTVANQVARLQARAPRFNLVADATVGVRAPYPAQFAVSTERLDLAALPFKLPGTPDAPTSGLVTARVRGKAELSNPKSADATAEVQQMNLTYAGQLIRSEGPIVAHYNRNGLRVQQATIVAGASQLQIGGEIPLQGATTSNLRINGRFDLQSAVRFAPAVAQKIDPQGQLLVDLTLRGSLEALDPEGTVTLREGGVAGPQLPAPVRNINMQAKVGDGAAEVTSLSAQFASAQITARGRLPFSLLPPKLPVARQRADGPATFEVDVRGLQVASLGNAPKNVTGLISLHAEATARRLNLASLEALLRFDQLQFELSGIPVQQQGASTFTVQNGIAHVQQFDLRGPATRLLLSGSTELAGERQMNLRLDGNTNAELASLFMEGVQLRGNLQMQVAVRGTTAAPDLQGTVTMTDGQLAMTDPRVEAGGLRLRVAMKGRRLQIAELRGTLNGGDLVGGGGIDLGRAGLTNADINLRAKDVYFNFPEGLHTISDLDLHFRSDKEERLVLGGEVRVNEGSFRQNLNLQGELLRALQGAGGAEEVELTTQRSELLERIRFNIAVNTDSPIVIDNNLAKTAIETNLRVVGTYYNPSLLGRVNLEEGGELYLQQHTAYVDRGVITFVSEARIQPTLDVVARTEAAGYDINIQMQGPANKLETTFTSDPSLPEPDIISILVFGRTLEDVRGSEVQVAQQQALSLLTGSLGTALSSQAENTLGLSTVRLEPSLLGGEANPTARLTLGEDITRSLRLIYSFDLVNTDDRIIIGEYDVTRRFITRVTKQADNSYRFDLNHDFRFGGESTTDLRFRSRPDRKVGSVTFTGNPLFEQKRLQDQFKVKPGDDYDFFKVRRGIDKLTSFYWDRQFLEANIRTRREEQGNIVNLEVQVTPGKKVDFIFEGWSVPGDARKRVRDAWKSGVFDLQRSQDAVGIIRGELLKRNYIDSEVRYDIRNVSESQKRVLFEITPGTRYRDVELVFDGARRIEADELRDALEKTNGLRQKVVTNFSEVKEFLEGYYRDQGFITATVSEPHLVTDKQAGIARVVIPIEEGPLYRIGKLEFKGNNVLPERKLREAALGLEPGRPYLPRERDPALLGVQTLFWDAGYNNVEIDYRVIPHQDRGEVDVVFDIVPNRQAVVQKVEITGTDNTTPVMIRSQLLLKPGDPLDYSKLSESRVNLYTTNAFQIVDLETVPVDSEANTDGPRQVALRVNVREVQPFQWRYGGYFDTDRGPGVISDFSNHNMLGDARVIGLYTRYDRDLQEARLYFNQPFLRRLPLKTNLAGYFVRNAQFDPITDASTFISDRFGFTLDQETRFRKDYVFTYGYRLERSRIIDLTAAIPPGDQRDIVAPLTISLTRERRDDLLNATRGSFLSQGLLTGFGFLGSSQRFIKYTGQYNQYLPLGEPKEVPFKRSVFKPRLVYAGSARIGLGSGFGGQDLILTERFFAGGGTTIRGFRQDEVGPRNSEGAPIGGNALFILNNELRFPLWKMFDGVGFIDMGNVYPAFSDFNPFDLRKTAGIGLRMYTPYVLLRADYGLKLGRRTGESVGAFFFSIGQAF